MSGSSRTRKWREKCAAEGKKSFTVLLSTDAQKIITSEKEKTGDNYSEILERALRSLIRLEYNNPAGQQSAQAATGKIESEPPAKSQPPIINRTRILIDDLQNYELNDDRIDFSYKQGPDYLNKNPKENLLKRITRFPGKKKWFW